MVVVSTEPLVVVVVTRGALVVVVVTCPVGVVFSG